LPPNQVSCTVLVSLINYKSWIITDQIIRFHHWQFQIAPVVKPRPLLGSFLFSMVFITVMYAALFV
jgi:hypothetical protein